jgi:hypothetical protein
MTALVRGRRSAPAGLSAVAVLARLRARGLEPEPRPHPVARAVATGIWLVAVLVQVAAVTVWLSRGAPHLPPSLAGGPLAIAAITLCSLLTLSMGAFLARRLPTNPVGWLLMGQGLILMPVLPSALMVHEALNVLRAVPAATALAAWFVSSVSAPVAIGSVTLVLVLFPDGRPTSRRWAAALAVPITGMLLLSVGSAIDRTLIWYPMLPSPFAVPGLGSGTAGALRVAGVVCMTASVFIAAGALLDRYRDGGAELRRQLRWVVLDGLLTAGTVLPLLVGRYLIRPGDAVGEVLVAVAALGAATFPIAVAIAITRADLFDIDLIIGRTLVYLPLTAILAGLYAALVAFLQRVFVAITGDTSDAVIVLTTLVLAAAFTPVRQALDGFVERHFKGPHGARGGAPAAAPVSVTGDGTDVDTETLLALMAANVERLEATEARLIALEHAQRPRRRQRLASTKQRSSSAATASETS